MAPGRADGWLGLLRRHAQKMNVSWGKWGATPTLTTTPLPFVAPSAIPAPTSTGGTFTALPGGYLPMPTLPGPPPPLAPLYTPEVMGQHWSEQQATQGVAPPMPLDTLAQAAAMQQMQQPQPGMNPWLMVLGALLVLGGVGAGVWWWRGRDGSRSARSARSVSSTMDNMRAML